MESQVEWVRGRDIIQETGAATKGGYMSRKVLAIAASVILILAIQVPPANAFLRWHHYDVIYSCICSPGCYGTLVGQWDEDCDGNYTGWGWEPGHECTYTDTSSGSCGPPLP